MSGVVIDLHPDGGVDVYSSRGVKVCIRQRVACSSGIARRLEEEYQGYLTPLWAKELLRAECLRHRSYLTHRTVADLAELDLTQEISRVLDTLRADPGHPSSRGMERAKQLAVPQRPHLSEQQLRRVLPEESSPIWEVALRPVDPGSDAADATR